MYSNSYFAFAFTYFLRVVSRLIVYNIMVKKDRLEHKKNVGHCIETLNIVSSRQGYMDRSYVSDCLICIDK